MDEKNNKYGFSVKEEELAEHINMLMKDYFQAEITLNGNALNFEFFNGQKFTVTVKECK